MHRLFCVVLMFGVVASYKILCFYPLLSRSPHMITGALVDGLLADGHEVTYVSAFSRDKELPNYTEILLDGIMHRNTRSFLDERKEYAWQFISIYTEYTSLCCNATLNHPRAQQLLRSDAKFDVIIIVSSYIDAMLGLGHHFKAPIVVFSTLGACEWHIRLVGGPMSTSYIPSTMVGVSDRMTLWQRWQNTFYCYLTQFIQATFYMPKHEEILRTAYPDDDMPAMNVLREHVALVLVNTDVTLNRARPYAQNMIEVGGLHINDTVTPLPTHLQKFMDEAEAGVILFSFGSVILMSSLPSDVKMAIVDSLDLFKGYRLLIKSDEDLVFPVHRDDDVLIQQWIPQQSVLAHPNLKLFVTHGGVASSLETIYFGKPIIAIPICLDQHFNAASLEESELGRQIPWEEFTGKKFVLALLDVLTTSKYRKNAKLMSDRFHDRIATPLQTAVHWVKHVAKNKGATYLRCASIDMPFYVYYNLDILALLAMAVGVVSLVIGQIVKMIIGMALKRKTMADVPQSTAKKQLKKKQK